MNQTTYKNPYVLHGKLVVLHLDNTHRVILNAIDLPAIGNYTWRAVRHGRCFYAKTTVHSPHRPYDLSMHRMIANTPTGMVCHHRNRNSLDNREANLCNMTKKAHDSLHSGNTLKIKYKNPPRKANTPPAVCEGGICP